MPVADPEQPAPARRWLAACARVRAGSRSRAWPWCSSRSSCWCSSWPTRSPARPSPGGIADNAACDVAGDGDAAGAVLADAGERDARLRERVEHSRAGGHAAVGGGAGRAVGRRAKRGNAAARRGRRWRLTARRWQGSGRRCRRRSEKQSVDCAGEGAAEAASAGSSPGTSGGGSPADAASPGASGSGLRTGDVQVVSSDTQALGGAAAKLDGDRASLSRGRSVRSWRARGRRRRRRGLRTEVSSTARARRSRCSRLSARWSRRGEPTCTLDRRPGRCCCCTARRRHARCCSARWCSSRGRCA